MSAGPVPGSTSTTLPVVLVPGLNNSASTWDAVRAGLVPEVPGIAVDCPPLDDIDAIGDALLTELPERFVLVGHSFGGYVAMAMLARGPQRIAGLVLVNCCDNADSPEQASARVKLADKVRAGDEAAYEARAMGIVAQAYHPDHAGDERLLAGRLAGVREYGSRRYVSHLVAASRRPDRGALLAATPVPILVLAADTDVVVPTANQVRMAERIGAGLQVVPLAGHMLPVEQPAAVARAIAEFTLDLGHERVDPKGGADATGPLEGLVVVELGRYVAAPFAGRLLADWGADVVKVEEPAGDPMRWGPLGERTGWSPQFASWNRGKRSITLDLRTEAGRTALRELLRHTDVLLHNLRASALERLGLAPEDLRAELPRLIVCGVSGFGGTGPNSGRRTFDAMVSAMSGLYSQFLDMSAPRPAGPAFTDVLAGMFAAQAVLAALHARDAGRGGQTVDVPMLTAATAVIDDAFTIFTETGVEPPIDARQARQQTFAATAADGENLIVYLGITDPIWQAFATAAGHVEWLDDVRYVDRRARLRNVAALEEQIRAALRQRPRAEWLARFAAADVPAAPLYSVAQAVADSDVAGTVLVHAPVRGGPPMRMTAPVGAFDGTPVAVPSGPPAAGEHTEEIIAELPLDDATRDAVLATWRTRRTTR